MLTYSELIPMDWNRIHAEPPVAWLMKTLLHADGAASQVITQIQDHPGLDAYIIGTSDVPSAITTEYDQDQTNYRHFGRASNILSDKNYVISAAPNSLVVAEFCQRKRLNDESCLFIIYLTESSVSAHIDHGNYTD